MNNKQAGEQLAAIITAHLKADNRSMSWLAGSIKMKYPTLRRQLKERPEKLSVFTLLAIEQALGIPFCTLLFPYFSK